MTSASQTTETPRVAILLCTYNGLAYLAEQLDSIIRQSHGGWVIYASDDGSSDGTLELLSRYRETLGDDRLVILAGPRQGFSKNFMSLIRNTSISADYYAFCDQDDVWYQDKLERALRALRASAHDIPALYCSRTHLIDAAGNAIGHSPLFDKTPSFANALVQSLAGANTMLLNQRARALLAQTPEDAHVVSHDWLTYLLVSGCEGRVIYDPQPTLDYRQHGANLIGANSSVVDRLRRIRKLFAGTFREWNDQNLYALSLSRHQFSPGNRKRLQCFERARQAGLLERLGLLKKANVYRQTLLGNIGLVVAAGLRRF